MPFTIETPRRFTRASLRRRRRECTCCSAHGFVAGVCQVCSHGQMWLITPVEYEPEDSLHAAHV